MKFCLMAIAVTSFAHVNNFQDEAISSGNVRPFELPPEFFDLQFLEQSELWENEKSYSFFNFVFIFEIRYLFAFFGTSGLFPFCRIMIKKKFISYFFCLEKLSLLFT